MPFLPDETLSHMGILLTGTATTASVEEITEGAPTSDGMLFACWAIVIVLLAMAFAFLRANKRDYAVAILPLVCTPLMYIISGVIARKLTILLPVSAFELRLMLDMSAGFVSCVLLGVLSRRLPSPRIRQWFLFFCAAFVMILTLVLVNNSLEAANASLF